MDVDGTLTDGGIYIGENGELFKPFNCRDGFGITLAKRAGIKIALITGRTSKQLVIRARELKIDEDSIWQGDLDKREAYIEVKNKFNLKDEEIAYIGDDILDLPVMMQVGFTGTVANAVTEVKTRVCVVSDFNGGQGAVREIIEFILKAKGLWQGIVADYLSPEMVRVNPFRASINPLAEENQPIKQPVRTVERTLKQTESSVELNQNPMKAAQPIKPTQPIKTTQPIKATQPIKTAQSVKSPKLPEQPSKTNDTEKTELEKLEQLGKKYNFKF